MNLLVPVQLCRGLIPMMNRGGAIINISGGGATSPRPNFTAYGTAKAALVRFSETLAVEAAPLGIRVNSIAPGIMRTRMVEQVAAIGERSGTQEFRKAQEVMTQGGTPPEKPAELAVFLASERCAGITGKLISAAWDPWHELPEHAAQLRNVRRLYAATDCPGGPAMNVAIVGCGLIGQKRAKALARSTIDGLLRYRRESRGRCWRGEIGGAVSTDWRETVARPDVDIVVIATTHDLLPVIATAAASNGKHVLMEKPGALGAPASSMRSWTRADGRARRSGSASITASIAACSKARELFESGALGPLMFVRGRYGHGGRVGLRQGMARRSRRNRAAANCSIRACI